LGTAATHGVSTLELAHKVSDELEVFRVVEKLQLKEGLVLSLDGLVKILTHVVDKCRGCLVKNSFMLNFCRVTFMHDEIRVVDKGQRLGRLFGR